MVFVCWELVDCYFYVVDWGNVSFVVGVIVVIVC